MGVTWKAHAVVGVRMCKDELSVTKREKAFGHDYPDDWIVCPKTGKKLWREYEQQIFGDDWEWNGIPNSDLLAFSEGTDSDYVYIGFGITTDDGNGNGKMMHLDAEKLEDIAKQIHDVLKPFGLHRGIEENMGVWAVLYCSY